MTKRRTKRPRASGLGNGTICKIGSSNQERLMQCGTAGKVTLCVGDRVSGKPWGLGTVAGVVPSRDPDERGKPVALVCWDNAERGDLAYPYQIGREVKKAR